MRAFQKYTKKNGFNQELVHQISVHKDWMVSPSPERGLFSTNKNYYFQ